MKFKTLYVLIVLSGFYYKVSSQALVNNYAKIYIKQGAKVYVKTNSVSNNDLIDNAGELTIEQDFVNNDTATGGGANGLYSVQRDWVNNGVFIADQSQVNLYGADQLITGTSSTVFYDLELTGTGIKRQTLNSETSDTLALHDRELATDSFEMLISNADPASITRTTGFVSSLSTGRLSRNTNSISPYLFPTGSSSGTGRYRPVIITASSSGNHTFGVRLANTDATTESFDRNAKDSSICEVNPMFYHRIYRSNGTDPADIEIHYDPLSDGDWQDIAHWQNIPQWEATNATPSTSSPFFTYIVNSWNDFSNSPFALTREMPQLTLTPTVTSCEGANNGAVTSNISGGQPPYQYIWNTGDTTANLSAIAGGTYSLTVSDDRGCSTTQSTVIEETNSLSSVVSITQTQCENDKDGAIKLIPSGGTAPYSATWSNGDTTLTISALDPGVYLVTVTDANSCTYETSIDLTSESVYSVEAVTTNSACDGTPTGSAFADIISATTPPYAYLWSTGDTTVSIANLAAGTYSLTVSDSLNCLKVDTALVVIGGVLSIVEDIIEPCPDKENGSIAIVVSGGTEPYSYSWSTGVITSSLQNIGEGIYSLMVTDQNDCSGLDTFMVLADSSALCDINIYDVFSPNGDGNNDEWEIDGLPLENEIQIFNRWGNVVFEAKPYTNDWEGRSKKGELLPAATYYYILKLNDVNSTTYSGHVTIVR